MLVAADAASAAPPWLAIMLAALTLLGVIATAAGPALLERAKRGKASPGKEEKPTVPTAPTVVERTDQALDLVSDAMADARHERDEAQADNRRLLRENSRLLKETGQLRALIYRLDPTWNGDSSGGRSSRRA